MAILPGLHSISNPKRIILSWLTNSSAIMTLKSWLPPLNFITLHYLYFIITLLLTSVIFYCSSNPKWSITYTDSLFLVVSAMTESGLNTVNLSQMTTFQQVLLFVLILMGSAIWVSIWTVAARKRAFERRFGEVIRSKRNRHGHWRRSSSRGRGVMGGENVGDRLDRIQKPGEPVDRHEFESRHSGPRDPTLRFGDGAGESEVVASGMEKESGDLHARGRTGGENHISVLQPSPSSPGSHRRHLSFASPQSPRLHHSSDPNSASGEKENQEDLNQATYPHYLTRYTTGRNAQFYGLTRAEREHLGGVEYRAITLLAYLVPIYFVLWQLLGALGLGAYMHINKSGVIGENGIKAWWLGIFNAVSAFNNSGMSLLDANLIPFQNSVYTLFTMGLLILAGNTAYPLFLRLILSSMLKLLCLVFPDPAKHSRTKATLRFILTYPRRVYTNLFPRAATYWLLFMVIVLNGIDWAAFELLNIGNPLTNAIPAHYRVLDGLFQAIAVRSGGFYIITITSLRIGLQVLYVIMMYISVYPVIITMRHSNVYEERSLGIYAEDDFETSSDIEDQPDGRPHSQERHPKTITGILRTTLSSLHSPFTLNPGPSTTQPSTNTAFIRQQIRGQLAHDLWLLVLGILLISCIEVSNFNRDPVTYSVFNIAFEVVSGYGCVGISTGLPNEAYSFSGGWKAASKLVLCGVMLRGRHRGLPVSLDRAVRLPGGEQEEAVEEEENARRSMSVRRGL